MHKSQRFLTLCSLTAMLCLCPALPLQAAGNPEPQNNTQKVKKQQTLVKVTGKITDETHEGVPGALVKVKNGAKGVMTDVDGTYSIEVPYDSELEVSFIGMTPKTFRANQNVVDVELRPQSEELGEVTVVAYGKQKKESIVGAISTIDAATLRIPVANLSSAIAGKIAGAVVMQRTAEPGAGADFWIRGISSFGANNRPLVLVDGVERSMDLVDPEDIQSFSILKDATATALYGVRGANGIVLITTKRGTESKPKVSAKVEYGFTNPVKLPKLANAEQWLKFYNDITLDASGSLAVQPTEMAKYINNVDPDLYPNVDWMKTIFKDRASTTRVNLNVTGGTQNVRYYVGGSFYTESSIFNIADNDRYDAQMRYTKFNFRANVDINVTRTTELGISLANLYATKNRPGYPLADIYTWTILTTPVSTPTIYSDGTPAFPYGGFNPYYLLNQKGYSQDFSNTSQSLISLTQDFSDIITPGLKANVKFAWDAANGSTLDRTITPEQSYVNVNLDGGRDENGNLIFHQKAAGNDYMTLARSNWGNRNWNFEASATYDRTFANKHAVSAMFNFNMRSYSNNFPGNYIAAFPNKNIGIAGRATYSFDSRYFAEFNFGYNGSENFSPKNRFGFFPSFAVGYILSNEKFWESLTPKWNLLKFKASYGEIGNDQIGGNRRFAFNTEMQAGANGFIWGTNHTIKIPGGVTTGVPGNDDVSWEKAIKKNFGVELAFFNNSLQLNADYFYEKRSGIYILQQSIPSVVGHNVQQYVNLGKMRNQGIDMSLEANRKFGDWFISARGTFTYNRNKKMYDDKPTPVWPYQSEAGFAYLQQRGLIALGLFESEEDIANSPKQTFGMVRPGDIKYKDINGDNQIDAYDRVAIGYTQIPEISYGFGVSASWKGFDFSVFFQGVGHITRLIGGASFYGASENVWDKGQIFAEVADNRWTLENPDPNAPYPRLAISKIANNQEASTYWQRDCSFIRLKNAEVGYTFPKKWFEKAGISTVRLYLQGVNLLTFSKFKLWDPELETANGTRYPQMRTGSIGLNVNF